MRYNVNEDIDITTWCHAEIQGHTRPHTLRHYHHHCIHVGRRKACIDGKDEVPYKYPPKRWMAGCRGWWWCWQVWLLMMLFQGFPFPYQAIAIITASFSLFSPASLPSFFQPSLLVRFISNEEVTSYFPNNGTKKFIGFDCHSRGWNTTWMNILSRHKYHQNKASMLISLN